MSPDWSEMLDEHDPDIKAEVDDNLNFKWDPFGKGRPLVEIQDSWGGHEDLPLGLDLQGAS